MKPLTLWRSRFRKLAKLAPYHSIDYTGRYLTLSLWARWGVGVPSTDVQFDEQTGQVKVLKNDLLIPDVAKLTTASEVPARV